MENWYIAEVHNRREAVVAYTLTCLDIKPFLPLILRAERVSNRTRQKEITAAPSLPGYVFFSTFRERVPDVNAIRDVKAIVSEGPGLYVTVPARQMLPFIDAHDRWHMEAREAFRRGRGLPGSGPRPKFQAMTKEVLAEYMRTHFRSGADDLAEVA